MNIVKCYLCKKVYTKDDILNMALKFYKKDANQTEPLYCNCGHVLGIYKFENDKLLFIENKPTETKLYKPYMPIEKTNPYSIFGLGK